MPHGTLILKYISKNKPRREIATMNGNFSRSGLAGLRWTLGIVVLLESLHFVLSHAVAEEAAKLGLPPWVRPFLGITEILAAILFLVPAASVLGGYLLLAVFAVAILVHLLHGQFDVGALLVYAMVVVACLKCKEALAKTPEEARLDRFNR